MHVDIEAVAPWVWGLPEMRDAVSVEHAIVAHNRDILELRLGDEHPIERIAMVAWQPTGPLCVQDVMSSEEKAWLARHPGDIGRHFRGARQLAEARFGGDFPRRRRADQNRVGVVADSGPRRQTGNVRCRLNVPRSVHVAI